MKPVVGADTDEKWYAFVDGKNEGPMNTADLIRELQKGRYTSQTFLWKQGREDWIKAREIPELESVLGSDGTTSEQKSMTTEGGFWQMSCEHCGNPVGNAALAYAWIKGPNRVTGCAACHRVLHLSEAGNCDLCTEPAIHAVNLKQELPHPWVFTKTLDKSYFAMGGLCETHFDQWYQNEKKKIEKINPHRDVNGPLAGIPPFPGRKRGYFTRPMIPTGLKISKTLWLNTILGKLYLLYTHRSAPYAIGQIQEIGRILDRQGGSELMLRTLALFVAAGELHLKRKETTTKMAEELTEIWSGIGTWDTGIQQLIAYLKR